MVPPGGLSETKEMDDEVEVIVYDLKNSVEEKLGRSLETYVPVSYKTQVVAGINYFVKVKISDSAAIHLRIYKHFSGEISLHGVSDGFSLSEQIVHF